MDTHTHSIRPVALMNVCSDEIEALSQLNTLWAMTMDREHDNVLAYPDDIQVERVEEIYPRKYIDLADFSYYVSEDGAPWRISNSLHIADIDAFFRCYLHLDETETAA